MPIKGNPHWKRSGTNISQRNVGDSIRLYDSTDVDYLELSHDGTYAHLDGNTTILRIGGQYGIGGIRRTEFIGDGTTNNHDVYFLSAGNDRSLLVRMINAGGYSFIFGIYWNTTSDRRIETQYSLRRQ